MTLLEHNPLMLIQCHGNINWYIRSRDPHFSKRPLVVSGMYYDAIPYALRFKHEYMTGQYIIHNIRIWSRNILYSTAHVIGRSDEG